MATRDVLALTLENGETFVVYESISEKNTVLRKAPIDPKDVDLVYFVHRDWIAHTMIEFQQKIEKETGVFPCDTVWVSGVRNIKKLGNAIPVKNNPIKKRFDIILKIASDILVGLYPDPHDLQNIYSRIKFIMKDMPVGMSDLLFSLDYASGEIFDHPVKISVVVTKNPKARYEAALLRKKENNTEFYLVLNLNVFGFYFKSLDSYIKEISSPEFSVVICHEVIHLSQFLHGYVRQTGRNKYDDSGNVVKPDKTSSHEIEAYAFGCLAALALRFIASDSFDLTRKEFHELALEYIRNDHTSSKNELKIKRKAISHLDDLYFYLLDKTHL